MLDQQARGFGTAKGIPTMVVAAASFDDVSNSTTPRSRTATFVPRPRL